MAESDAPFGGTISESQRKGGGSYHPGYDVIMLSNPLPASFPHLVRISGEHELEYCATALEEFVHRLQFSFTQVGLLHRLCWLTQAQIAIDVLKLLGGNPRLHLEYAVGDSDGSTSRLGKCVEDLALLQKLRVLLFSDDETSNSEHDYELQKGLLKQRTHLTLSRCMVFDELHLRAEQAAAGEPTSLQSSTRRIYESHASAYAFLLLEGRFAGQATQIRSLRDQTRTGMYHYVDWLFGRNASQQIDLTTILVLSSYPMEGRVFDTQAMQGPERSYRLVIPHTRYLELARHINAFFANPDPYLELDAMYHGRRRKVRSAKDVVEVLMGQLLNPVLGDKLPGGFVSYQNALASFLEILEERFAGRIAGAGNAHERTVLRKTWGAVGAYFQGLLIADPEIGVLLPTYERFLKLVGICGDFVVEWQNRKSIVRADAANMQPDYRKINEAEEEAHRWCVLVDLLNCLTGVPMHSEPEGALLSTLEDFRVSPEQIGMRAWLQVCR